MSVCTFYPLVVWNVYNIAMITGQVTVMLPKTLVMSPEILSRVAQRNNCLKDQTYRRYIFCSSFPTMLQRL